ncbi:ATP-binding cassette domain-containing protein [Paenibacillus sp. YN15]|uniref:ATP-binding cassette domain-containing protein n=1 Tax=Paenibacillus sp. YN15 TaxID=1742774 RepID=UPI000DCF4D45|nr:ATP-binding cassette domain-containing protein [Paenibacillus sp. YN15]RAU92360.1 ABC transporter ATP-binding protein [Paenibacillus sp. YN15]
MEKVQSITICGGRDKYGQPEDCLLHLVPGDIAAVVGPTGSGKSRLLADIEYLAQRDTPSGRQILLNGQPPDPAERFGIGTKLIAQLSQNMNFVLDATVGEFIAMHAACLEQGEPEASSSTGMGPVQADKDSPIGRDSGQAEPEDGKWGGAASSVESVGTKVAHSSSVGNRPAIGALTLAKQVLEQANRLAGEAFTLDTPLTALSGGQSRALMIADTAILSDSPIVLIDEIENAGIDKRLALEVLVDRQKIVIMATHDPILALSGHYRLVLGNGALRDVLKTEPGELALLEELRAADGRLALIRQALRAGERLHPGM